MKSIYKLSLLLLVFIGSCNQGEEEEAYDSAVEFLNANPIITTNFYSSEFNELQVHSASQGSLMSDVSYYFAVNSIGDFQITENFNNCTYENTDARVWLNIYGANFKANFKDIISIKENISTEMEKTTYELILNFEPITVGSLCMNKCLSLYSCDTELPSFTNSAPGTRIFYQQYLIFNDVGTRATYKKQFEILRDGF